MHLSEERPVVVRLHLDHELGGLGVGLPALAAPNEVDVPEAAWRKTAFMYGLVHFHISLQLPEPGHGVAILYFALNRVYRSATNELFFPAPSKN